LKLGKKGRRFDSGFSSDHVVLLCSFRFACDERRFVRRKASSSQIQVKP
jgi:hypothetical protein